MVDLFGDTDSLIPAITLWQPWASLIFSGHKRCETRSFAPPFKYVGKRIAIHAAAALPASRHFSEELCELCYDAFGCSWNFSLPRGVILGTVTLGGFYPTEKIGFIAPDERAAGDWSDGRYAWQLLDAEALASPVPAKGKQGWWKVAASVGRNPEGEDRADGLRRNDEHAVGEAETPDLSTPSHTSGADNGE